MAQGGTTRPSKLYTVGIARQVSVDSRNTPPFWHFDQRRASSSSTATVAAPGTAVSQRGPIALEDHTEECSESSGPLWAKQVTIDGYAVVARNTMGNGGHVEWDCTVEVLDVSFVVHVHVLHGLS